MVPRIPRSKRNANIDRLSAEIARKFGKSQWTTIDLKRYKIQISGGAISYMHNNGLLRHHHFVQRNGHHIWSLTIKGLLRANRAMEINALGVPTYA